MSHSYGGYMLVNWNVGKFHFPNGVKLGVSHQDSGRSQTDLLSKL